MYVTSHVIACGVLTVVLQEASYRRQGRGGIGKEHHPADSPVLYASTGLPLDIGADSPDFQAIAHQQVLLDYKLVRNGRPISCSSKISVFSSKGRSFADSSTTIAHQSILSGTTTIIDEIAFDGHVVESRSRPSVSRFNRVPITSPVRLPAGQVASAGTGRRCGPLSH